MAASALTTHSKNMKIAGVKTRPVPSTPADSKPTMEIADWVNDTPPDNEYCLMITSESTALTPQSVDLTRNEYIALKRHLAALRGLGKIDVTESIARVSGTEVAPNITTADDQESAARDLRTARVLYRLVPDAVVIADEAVDRELLALGYSARAPRVPAKRATPRRRKSAKHG